MRNHRTRALVAAACLLLAAQAAAAKDTWTSVRSQNFFLVGNASEKEIRQVATRLEQFRDVFTKLLKVNFTTPVPTTVVVFKNDSAYKPFKPVADGKIVEVGGYLGRLVNYHLQLLRDQRLIPLSQLFAVTHYSLERNKHDVRSLFYAESWALMHYLILGNDGKRLPQLSEFLALTKKGVPTEEAVKRAFQTDTAAMEKELQKYVQAYSFQGRLITFERKLEFESQMTSAPLTDAEAEAYLGDLLLHINRPDDAAVRLQHALELDPTNV